ncbi:MAG: transcriptional regulator NrdR [Phycisphaeraceae bacterium]|nr:transcriptional regulator NrdR [Phycisphaeraceae bacterium]
MFCPFCQTDDDKVIDSRSSDQGRTIRRRRECNACGRRFTTYERIEDSVKLSVIKRDGSRVPYNREKQIFGLEKACYKRPVAAEQLSRAIEGIEDELFRSFEKEVASIDIGKIVSRYLKNLDQVAYVRFASVYKQFQDIEQMLDEVKDVMESGAPDPRQKDLF